MAYTKPILVIRANRETRVRELIHPIKIASRNVSFNVSLLYITIASYSDSDTSSESGYESGQESVHESDCDDENENLEPEPDARGI